VTSGASATVPAAFATLVGVLAGAFAEGGGALSCEQPAANERRRKMATSPRVFFMSERSSWEREAAPRFVHG
jgi:hypothetical protein